MTAPYKLTVPRTKGELDDHLGMMVLSCPDFDDSLLPGRDKGAIFEELQLGIEGVVQPGPTREAMLEMCEQVRSFCDAQRIKAAIQVLEAMAELLRRKSVH